MPAKYKKEPWARLGVNVENDFEPLYVIDSEKKQRVADLKKRLDEADELLLATDEDREGEAIAWHLSEVLKPKVPARRMVFHEITRDAIERALLETRDIDARLVDAQETRRILDRLYGYEVSPVLWKKIMPRLSAGRVQSVATRLVVERERARRAFVAADVLGHRRDVRSRPVHRAARRLDGKRVAQGRDFDSLGVLAEGSGSARRAAARRLADCARGLGSSRSASVDEKPYTRRPAPPFMTSTLQQEASRKLRFTSQTTMRVAQRLYENGYITYMRTDSTTLAESALAAARDQARELYGAEYVPEKPRHYDRKVKNAQEAHEAVRPAGDRFRTPQEVKGELSRDEHALYDLIWKRTIASQMKDATGSTVSVRLGARASSGEDAEFGASGTTITFRGFLAAYEEGRDEAVPSGDEERLLPPMSEGDRLDAQKLEPQGHSTTPPARYTEATLVRALEERGIGRPSTYASIMGTILDRGYVFKRGTALVPSFLAFSVVALLEQHFEKLVDYDFTARMEDDLDRIAEGEEHRVEWLKRFYFGSDGDEGLHDLVTHRLGDIDAREINSIPIGNDITLRIGRYGPYLERERQARLDPRQHAARRADRRRGRGAAREAERRPGARRQSRDGPHGRRARRPVRPVRRRAPPEGSDEKPRTSSLFKSMSLETVTLEEALRLLSLPRTLGEVEGEEVTAQNGRYGPYVQKGKETRSLESEEQLFTITPKGARAPVQAEGAPRGAARPPGPLREIGPDPGREARSSSGTAASART